MLDFFTIFSKGGIVLWCFQGAGVSESFTGPVNALIRSVILQVSHKVRTNVLKQLSVKQYAKLGKLMLTCCKC